MKREYRTLFLLAVVIIAVWIAPIRSQAFYSAVGTAMSLLQEYARLHLVTSLLPALLLAGAISTFLKGSLVIRYLGPSSPRFTAFAVASVAGCVLAVCSCTVLPMFAGIYSAGAGIGPASTFLYSGPAINVLAFVLTTRILGPGLGIARAMFAVLLSIGIGFVMSLLFRRSVESVGKKAGPPGPGSGLPLGRVIPIMTAATGILLFARSGCPCEESLAFVPPFASWGVVIACAVAEAAMIIAWLGVPWWKPALAAVPVAVLAAAFPGEPRPAFLAGLAGFSAVLATSRDQAREWFEETVGLAVKVLPLLLGGVAVTGFLLGTSDSPGLIPYRWLEALVGGDSPLTTLAASVAGAFMYFATLTEVPIVQGLVRSGMGNAPALALLLSGPALSLPSMLVIRSIIGTRRTVIYILLVIVFSTSAGLIYGASFPD